MAISENEHHKHKHVYWFHLPGVHPVPKQIPLVSFHYDFETLQNQKQTWPICKTMQIATPIDKTMPIATQSLNQEINPLKPERNPFWSKNTIDPISLEYVVKCSSSLGFF